MKSKFVILLHKLVKYPQHISDQHVGGNRLEQNIALKSRRTLEAKMATVFGTKIKILSPELQKILLDDMVTAFENRLNVLNRAQAKSLHAPN
jgi:hypothetical protein